MKRRQFITLLGGAAAAWPMAAQAQQMPVPVIGVLSGASRAEFSLPAFAQGLRQQGYVEDRNVSIQYSWAEGHFDLLPSMATEFVRRRVAVIVAAQGTVTAEAAKTATSTIPIVFLVGSDPVAAGLVKSLNRPGGNLTGATAISVELAPKRLELLRDLVPSVRKIGFLINPANRTYSDTLLEETQSAAARLGKEVHAVAISNDGDFDPAFEQLIQIGVGALLVSNDPFYRSRRERIVALAAHHRIPTVYSISEFVKAGGLMSYGTNFTFAHLTVGDYAGRILKGAKPTDLPVVQPASFELAINLKAARSLGLEFPALVAARATEVFE